MANPTGTITLNDFRAGIHGDYHAGVVSAGNTVDGSIPAAGAATIENTYRCCSDSTGALIPLPRRVRARTQVFTTTVGYDPLAPGVFVMDALVLGPLRSTSPGSGASAADEAVAVALTMNRDLAGGSTYRQLHRIRLYEPYQSGSSVLEMFWHRSREYLATLPHFQLATTRNAIANDNPDVHLAWTLDPANDQSLGTVDNAIPSDEQAVTTFDTDTTNGTTYPFGSNVFVWPKAGDADVSTVGSIFGRIYNRYLAGHQGRLVAASRGWSEFGASTKRWLGDSLAFNRANTLITNSLVPGYTALTGTYGEENTSGIGVLASTSADQLLIIKNHGGGYLVQGDIENPTVSRLPYIESTYGVSIVPAYTPLGLVYASRNGVFSWAGGDTTTRLSTQLDGMFFDHRQLASEVYSGNSGRMDFWHPWVCVPNNYLLDTRTGGWWRLDAPTVNTSTPYAHYSVVPSTGQLYAFPYKLDATQNTMWDRYDQTILAPSYSWQSQPLVETRDRFRTFQTITLVASPGASTGEHTVVVTLSGYDQNGDAITPVATTFTFEDATGNGRPVVMTADIKPNFTAMYVQARLETSTDDDSAACKIHSVNLGYRDAQGVPKS